MLATLVILLGSSTHTPVQEAAAQLIFWGSIGGLPLSIVLFILAFRMSRRAAALAFVAGGLLLTQFLWYFVYLGIALSDKLGTMHAPSWVYFAPIGFGVALLLFVVAGSQRKGDAAKTGD